MLESLHFSRMKRVYDIEFNHFRILQINGDSSTGKSLLCSDFRVERKLYPSLQNSLVIDYDNSDDIAKIAGSRIYDYVLIDNADIVLSPEYDEIIRKKILELSPTYWILMGRAHYKCVLSHCCIGALKTRQSDNGITTFYIDYMGG